MSDPESLEFNEFNSSNHPNSENEVIEFLEKSRNQKSALLKLLRFVEGKTTGPADHESDPMEIESNKKITNDNSSLT